MSMSPAGAQQPVDGKRGVVEYAPHLRIDWHKRRVEVDGRVVLREGMLELFACSPHTREHESIVVVEARPLRIYEALGLLGINPGHPIRYDAGGEHWVPAAGDPLRIEVRWRQDGAVRTADIGTWMRDIADDKPVPPGVWRFAGSAREGNGAFVADADGTVICVVDFSSALIALPEMKSADNAALWVRAHTPAIPPVGTPVELWLWPVEPVVMEVVVDADGRVIYNDQATSMKRLIERLRSFQEDHAFTRVAIRAHAAAPSHLLERVRDAVERAAKKGTEVRMVVSEPKVDRPTPPGHSERP